MEEWKKQLMIGVYGEEEGKKNIGFFEKYIENKEG